VLAYPALRQTDWVPTDMLIRWASAVSTERADSLDFRFRNEDALLDRARQRVWFGWGGFGRTHYSERRRGKDLVADGFWIIRFSSRGVAGQVGYVLLFVVPILQSLRVLERAREQRERILLAGAGLVVATYALDTLPNGLWSSFPLVLAGGLAAASRGHRHEARRRAKPASAKTPPSLERSQPRAASERASGARPPLRGAGRWR
jgi:hypothetical protein